MSESQQVRDEVDSLRRILRERKTEVAAREALDKSAQFKDVATLGNPAREQTPGPPGLPRPCAPRTAAEEGPRVGHADGAHPPSSSRATAPARHLDCALVKEGDRDAPPRVF